MSNKTLLQSSERARRFALHLPIYFRQPLSGTWLEGTTENVSYTGVLFRSPYPIVPETPLELRLQLAIGASLNHASEIRCKGAVVRVEPRNAPESPIAVAVAISDYRIVRRAVFKEGPVGGPQSHHTPPKAGRRMQ
jgi:hypothetical protein